jgi:hypothetical protein
MERARIMTQLSDSTWVAIHSMVATLLMLAWIYIRHEVWCERHAPLGASF